MAVRAAEGKTGAPVQVKVGIECVPEPAAENVAKFGAAEQSKASDADAPAESGAHVATAAAVKSSSHAATSEKDARSRSAVQKNADPAATDAKGAKA